MRRILGAATNDNSRPKFGNEFRGAFVIATFRRPELLESVLRSIYGAELSNKYYKVIVFQGGDSKSLEIINSYHDKMTILVRVSGENKTALENITGNYMTGLAIAFDYCRADFAIEVEDDSIISSFALNFIENVLGKYYRSPKFRGINLGSYENLPEYAGTYSKLRTGFHATHGVITYKSWKYLSKPKIKNLIRTNPLDSTVESFWKTGYVITPNLSLCENFGWVKGTHASSNSSDLHYQKMTDSFNNSRKPAKWVLKNIDHTWQPKPIRYRFYENPEFIIKFLLDSAWQTRIGCKIKTLKKILKNKLKTLIH